MHRRLSGFIRPKTAPDKQSTCSLPAMSSFFSQVCGPVCDCVLWRDGAHAPWVRVAAASASLPMVCPFAIGKAFGLAAATRFNRHFFVPHPGGGAGRGNLGFGRDFFSSGLGRRGLSDAGVSVATRTDTGRSGPFSDKDRWSGIENAAPGSAVGIGWAGRQESRTA